MPHNAKLCVEPIIEMTEMKENCTMLAPYSRLAIGKLLHRSKTLRRGTVNADPFDDEQEISRTSNESVDFLNSNTSGIGPNESSLNSGKRFGGGRSFGRDIGNTSNMTNLMMGS